ncbi:MAG: amidohydrolase family protein [Muribaculaceae bacterium]|nr:amidohydrolase family protein [Muribaculaceae bacterium]
MLNLIYNAVIATAERVFSGFIIFDSESGLILHVGEGTPSESPSESYIPMDAAGAFILPGVIDPHVHFRDGGAGSPKGDMRSESRAAVAGGVTTVFDMPNTTPPTVTIDALRQKILAAGQKALCDIRFFFGVTNNNLQELLKAQREFDIAGAKLFMGSSTGNMLVDDDSTIRRLFREYTGVIAVHAEDQHVINSNIAAMKRKYPEGDVPLASHPEIRSAEACFLSASKAVELARETGARLHVCHLSTARELELFSSAPVQEKRITSETAPHYLLFSNKDYATLGARIKCNPAIKTEADRKALIAALKNGLIDVIATDHAPHLPADKEGDALHAMSGMPGVQFSLPLMMDLAEREDIPLTRLVALMSANAATIFSLTDRGDLRPGMRADMVMVRHLSTPHVITDADVVSLCGWTPYAGMTTSHEVVATWIAGKNIANES